MCMYIASVFVQLRGRGMVREWEESRITVVAIHPVLNAKTMIYSVYDNTCGARPEG